jgi:hypothetical protein
VEDFLLRAILEVPSGGQELMNAAMRRKESEEIDRKSGRRKVIRAILPIEVDLARLQRDLIPYGFWVWTIPRVMTKFAQLSSALQKFITPIGFTVWTMKS